MTTKIAGKNNGSKVQSVERALQIFDILAKSSDGLNLTQIAQKMNLPKSTAYGLVSTLRDHNYVEQASDSGKYFLGIRLFELGTHVARSWDIRDVAKPVIKRLNREFGETVHLGCEDNGEVLYLDKINADNLVNIMSEVGVRLPMHCSGLGKALLSTKSGPELKRFFQTKGLPALTSRTITSQSKLEKELIKIRKQGYAIDDGEVMFGLRCVAAPILDENDKAKYAISISGQVRDIYGKKLDKMIIEIQKAAQDISKALQKNT